MAIRTHYDVLQVARTASPDVIAAAYRSLSRHYHPDRNPGDQSAEARMAELNAAYAVLGDEQKRREHDRWIAGQEGAARALAGDGAARGGRPAARRAAAGPGARRREAMWWLSGGIAAAAAMLVALSLRTDDPPPEMPSAQPPPPAAAAPAVLPPVADGGILPPLQPAPSRPAGYLDAASANDGGGRSRITLDNRGGAAAVEVELQPRRAGGARRRAYLPAGGIFVMERIRGGPYRLRFRDLSDGSTSIGDAFQLGGGGQPGDVTVRLFRQ